MAQVPYSPEPTPLQPTDIRGPQVNATPGAFGVNIAQSMEKLGATAGQAGNELFARAMDIQRVVNETKARDQLSALSQEMAPLQANFDSLKGPAAREGLQGHLKAVNDLRLKYRQGLSPLAGVMYDAEAGNLQNWTVRTSTAHAVQENKAWVTNSYKAQADLISQHQEDDPDTDVNARRTQVGDLAVRAAMEEHGVGPDDPIAKDARLRGESLFERRRLQGLSKAGRSDEALKELQSTTKLSDEDRIQITSQIEGRAVATATSNVAQDIFTKYRQPDGSYTHTVAQMQDEARDRIAEQFAGNKDLISQGSRAVVGELDRLTSGDRYATRVDDLDTRNQIAGIVAEFGIKNAQEFQANPKGAQIYDKMTPVQRRGLDNAITKLNNQALTVTDETLKYTIKGKRNSDLEDYLNQNPYDPKWHLSPKDADEIANDQAKLIRKPSDDPRVTRAMKYLQQTYGPAMETAGLMFRNKKDPDDYDHFMGALEAWLQIHIDQTGKPATNDDLDKEWPTLIRQQMQKGFFSKVFGTEGSPDYVYKQWQRPTVDQVPEEYRQLAIGEAVKGGGSIPSDTQIYHRYLADVFNKLFQQEQKTQEPAGGGPPRR